MVKYLLKDGRSVRQYLKTEENPVPIGALYYRLRFKGMTLDEAVAAGVWERTKHYVQGKTFRQFCKDNGKSYFYWLGIYLKGFTHMTIEDFTFNVLMKTPKHRTGLKTYCDNKGYKYRSLYCNWYTYHQNEKSFKQHIKDWEERNGYCSELT